MLLDRSMRFEGFFLNGLGFYSASGTWKLKKGSATRPLSADTEWSVLFNIDIKEGIKVEPYEVELALFDSLMIDVWNGPEEKVYYKH